jgi:cytosine/adenosine deaminase-related metal-dependent hydrolase
MKSFLNLRNIEWACHHLHIDKAYTANKTNLIQSLTHMKEKWELMRDIKKEYSNPDLFYRMNYAIHKLYNQNCRYMRTFIDVDHIVDTNALDIAKHLQILWKEKGVLLQIGVQPLEGLDTAEKILQYEKACEKADFIGCLPSRDTSQEHHLSVVFDIALKHNKDIEAHLDQCNIPSERETELFCKYYERYRDTHQYTGKARAIHSISLASQPLDYQEYMADYLSNLNVGVIICPSAALSMTQHTEYTSPIHNSIAPLSVLLKHNVKVGLGVDNIQDIFMPFCDGNLEFELRLLAESTRTYDPSQLETIAINKMGFYDFC